MAVVSRPLPDPTRCLLCLRPPAYLGVYIPKDQASVNAPPGKVRNIVYMLCKVCFADAEGSQRKVEDMVLAEFAHTRN